jgi:hypothetical protein
MSTTTPPAPPDLEALLRRLRMPHSRAAAPDVLATARSQALGTRRSPAGVVHRGGRRAGPLRAGHPPGPGGVSHRENVPRLETRSLIHTPTVRNLIADIRFIAPTLAPAAGAGESRSYCRATAAAPSPPSAPVNHAKCFVGQTNGGVGAGLRGATAATSVSGRVES